jgi:hypothetical protein
MRLFTIISLAFLVNTVLVSAAPAQQLRADDRHLEEVVNKAGRYISLLV